MKYISVSLKNSIQRFTVDDKNYERVNLFTWNMATASIQAKIGNKKVSIGEFILGYRAGYEVDHRDGDIFNNLESNLRYATHSQNNINKEKYGSGLTSKYKGVCYRKERCKWSAEIQVNRKRLKLGCYYSEIAAAKAYDNAAKLHFGEFARLNFA